MCGEWDPESTATIPYISCSDCVVDLNVISAVKESDAACMSIKLSRLHTSVQKGVCMRNCPTPLTAHAEYVNLETLAVIHVRSKLHRVHALASCTVWLLQY